MRSMKVEPGAAVMRTLIWSESTVVPPVTAERSPPASRMTGADSPVIAHLVDRSEALDDLAVAGDDVAGFDQHDVADAQVERVDAAVDAARDWLGSTRRLARVSLRRLAQGVGLRLAAPLRHRFGEIGEQHREPQPERDLAGEQRRVLHS